MDITELPQSPDALKEIIKKLLPYKEKVEFLEEEVRLLKSKLFAKKSEKLTPEDDRQARLFNEAETYGDSKTDGTPKEKYASKTTVKGYTRKKPGRKPLPEHLPRKEVIIDIDESEKQCACGHRLSRIGEETSEKIQITPPQVVVEKTIRPKYACKHCEGTTEEDKASVKIAPPPVQFIKKSIATASFVAYLLISKFEDALPFYRQEKMLKRIDLEVSRASMCNWAIIANQKTNRLLKLMAKDLSQTKVLGCDETVLQVLNEPNKANTTKSYMWVFHGVVRGSPIVLYRYRPTRSAKFLHRLLKNYNGYMQTDGYKSYKDLLKKIPSVTHVACWAHARRKFHDAYKNSKKGKPAKHVLGLIKKLYIVEAEAKDLEPEQRQKLRLAKSKPVIDELKTFLDKKFITVTPESLLGIAVKYALNHWRLLLVYLEDGDIPIDNNRVENKVRPFVIGRKNFMFSGIPKGARASSGIYSLIETAKANNLNTYWYLRYLFEEITIEKSDEELIKLLPYNIDQENLNEFTAKSLV